MAKKTKKVGKPVGPRGLNHARMAEVVTALEAEQAQAKQDGAKKAAKFFRGLIRQVRKLDATVSREVGGAGKREAKRNKVAQKIAALKAILKTI